MGWIRDSLAEAWHRAPDPIFVPVQARRMRKYYEAQGVIFIHIPKNAGTSLNEALYGRGMPHFRAAEVREALGPRYHELLSFCVVRDPLERAVSSYFFAKSGGTGEVPMRSARKMDAETLATFDAFVFGWLNQIDLMRADFVFHPQHHYVSMDGQIIVDEVLRLNTLATDLEVVERRIGRSLQLPRRNETRPGGTRGLLEVTPAARREIERIYAEDYEVFKFPTSVMGSS